MNDKVINDAMVSIEYRVKEVYNQGYSDGLADGNINSGLFADKVREAYNNGLADAWECARKILFDGSLPRDILTELGADSFCGVIHKCSASEAIEKIKEYEERQKQTEEKTDKSCESCRFVDLKENEFPCSCCSKAYGLRWQLKDKEGDT